MRSLLIIITTLISVICPGQQKNISLPLSTRMTQLPWNRMIQPAGVQIVFGSPTLENHSLDAALSPDGKWLAVEERYSIVIINTETNKVAFVLFTANHPDLKGGANTYSGIIWHSTPSGDEIWWSTTGAYGRCFAASATWNGSIAVFGRMFEYRTIPPAEISLPNELLIRKEKGG